MSDPAIIGVVTGILVAIGSGIGVIIAIKKYSHVKALQAQQLRVELRKAFTDLELIRRGIEEYLHQVFQSRQRVMAARGQWNGGAGELFRAEFEADMAQLRRLLQRLPQQTGEYLNASPTDLETEIVSVHRSTAELRTVRQKYENLLQEDNAWRRDREARH